MLHNRTCCGADIWFDSTLHARGVQLDVLIHPYNVISSASIQVSAMMSDAVVSG
jgi:hypothetical protein